MGTIVRILAGPVKARYRSAVLSVGDGVGIEQARFRSVQKPCQGKRVHRDGSKLECALVRGGSWFELLEHALLRVKTPLPDQMRPELYVPS